MRVMCTGSREIEVSQVKGNVDVELKRQRDSLLLREGPLYARQRLVPRHP